MRLLREELQGFGDLDGGGEVDGRGEDPGGVASFDVAGGGGGEDAGEAGRGRTGFRAQGPGFRGLVANSNCRSLRCGGKVRRLRSRGQICGGSRGQISGWTLGPEPWTLGRQDVHGGGVGSYGGGVDPGARVADAEVVDEVAGFEVVGAVEDDVGAQEVGGVGWDEVGDVGVDVDAGVDAGEVAAGGFGFGEGGAGVVFVEEHLALEVGGLDEVAIDEGEAADAGAGEEAGGGGSGGSDADDGDVGSSKKLLAGFADGGEEDLAGVSVCI